MSDETINQLNSLVADFTVFYQKIRHFHWNVKGKQFFRLHEKFEEIYTELGDTIDEVAERIVALGGVPLHTLAHMLEETSLSEEAGLIDGTAMVAQTVGDIQVLSDSLLKTIAAAEAADDRTTMNLLDDINDGLQHHLWMLKAWQGK
jgi:starvation-inducible DNA-binding protein